MSASSATRGRRRLRRGRVKSDKRDKTISVVVEWKRQHPLYGKYVRQRTVLHVHDERNEAVEGDLVEVQETRPLSKTKRWRLVKVLDRAKLTAHEAKAADEATIESQTVAAKAEAKAEAGSARGEPAS